MLHYSSTGSGSMMLNMDLTMQGLKTLPVPSM